MLTRLGLCYSQLEYRFGDGAIRREDGLLADIRDILESPEMYAQFELKTKRLAAHKEATSKSPFSLESHKPRPSLSRPRLSRFKAFDAPEPVSMLMVAPDRYNLDAIYVLCGGPSSTRLVSVELLAEIPDLDNQGEKCVDSTRKSSVVQDLQGFLASPARVTVHGFIESGATNLRFFPDCVHLLYTVANVCKVLDCRTGDLDYVESIGFEPKSLSISASWHVCACDGMNDGIIFGPTNTNSDRTMMPLGVPPLPGAGKGGGVGAESEELCLPASDLQISFSDADDEIPENQEQQEAEIPGLSSSRSADLRVGLMPASAGRESVKEEGSFPVDHKELAPLDILPPMDSSDEQTDNSETTSSSGQASDGAGAADTVDAVDAAGITVDGERSIPSISSVSVSMASRGESFPPSSVPSESFGHSSSFPGFHALMPTPTLSLTSPAQSLSLTRHEGGTLRFRPSSDRIDEIGDQMDDTDVSLGKKTVANFLTRRSKLRAWDFCMFNAEHRGTDLSVAFHMPTDEILVLATCSGHILVYFPFVKTAKRPMRNFDLPTILADNAAEEPAQTVSLRNILCSVSNRNIFFLMDGCIFSLNLYTPSENWAYQGDVALATVRPAVFPRENAMADCLVFMVGPCLTRLLTSTGEVQAQIDLVGALNEICETTSQDDQFLPSHVSGIACSPAGAIAVSLRQGDRGVVLLVDPKFSEVRLLVQHVTYSLAFAWDNILLCGLDGGEVLRIDWLTEEE